MFSPFLFGVTKFYSAKESENLVSGKFPDGLFSDEYFPDGQLPERTIFRTDISPMERTPNDIPRKVNLI